MSEDHRTKGEWNTAGGPVVDVMIHVSVATIEHRWMAQLGGWLLNHAGIKLDSGQRYRRFMTIDRR